MYIRTWFGLFIVKNEEIVGCSLFPKDPHTLAERMRETPAALSTGNICNIDLPTLAINHGFVKDVQEYYQLLQDVTLKVVRDRIKSHWRKDTLIIQVINTIDELDEGINLLQERLHRLYTIHFPEHNLQGEALTELITEHPSRVSIPPTHPLHDQARDSTGMSLQGEERLIASLAENIQHLHELRRENQEYLNNTLPHIAPNLTALVGVTLAARLISLAGSLERLACMPASTIQIIGAHKALFKHLRRRTPPPKHGIIYQHPHVKGVPRSLRGRTARILAANLAMAARIDHYRGELMPELKRRLEEQITSIKNTKTRHKTP